MAQRRLALHASALSDAEYAVYTASLKDLVLGDSDAHDEGQGEDDEYFARMQMSVREARAWLRGRYADVPVQTIDTILRFFSASLAPGDTMSGTEFFAALRLVVHASNGGGQEVDRGLAFVQADPTIHHHAHAPIAPTSLSNPGSRTASTPSSRAQSPTKRYNPFSQTQPQLTLHGPSHLVPSTTTTTSASASPSPSNHLVRDPPPPQHPQHPASLAHTHAAYTSYRRDGPHGAHRSDRDRDSVSAASRPRSQGQGSAHSQPQSQGHGHNPFSMSATVHTVPIASSSGSTSSPVPPLIPPRKPPSEGSAAVSAPATGSGAPTSSSTLNKRKSAPPVPPPRSARGGKDDRERSMSPTKTPAVVSRSGSVVRPAPPLPPSGPAYNYASPNNNAPAYANAMPQTILAQHVTTPLMRQSLHAAQIGQSLQRAEARMEKERVMQVLRTSAGGGGGGGFGSSAASGASADQTAGPSAAGASGAGEAERGRAPPLPQRRPSGRVPPPPPAQGSKPVMSAAGASRETRGRQQLPSPPSSMGSMGSLDKVALAGGDRDGNRDRERERGKERDRENQRERDERVRDQERLGSRSPTKAAPPPPPPPAHPQMRRRETVSAAGSPSPVYAEPTTSATPSRPPPTHPDRARRNLESFEAVYGPSLVFPTGSSSSNLTDTNNTTSVARSPFSPVSPSPPPSAPASASRYGFVFDGARAEGGGEGGRATPPGVTPRVGRSKSMHHHTPPPAQPVYGGAAAPVTTTVAAGGAAGGYRPSGASSASASPFSPFAAVSPAVAAAATASSKSAQGSPVPPPPPPPPARRKRPESVQVLPSSSNSSGPGGPFGLVSPKSGTMNAYGVVAAAGYGASKRDIPAGGGMGYIPPAKNAQPSATPRRGSAGSRGGSAGAPSDGEREPEREDVFAALAVKDAASAGASPRPNPIAGLKNTFASANAALLPTLERAREGLDKARYKAEAGLSRRGYMRHGVGYGYASGEAGAGGDEPPLGDDQGVHGDEESAEEEELRGAMGGLSIAREREKDRARERQEMAGLMGGVDGRMKAPSVRYHAKQRKTTARDDTAAAAAQPGHGYGYELERAWDSDEDRPSVDHDVGPEVDLDAGRDARALVMSGEKDNLKWPAGEGWKPL